MSLTDLSYLEEKFIFHLCKHYLLSNRFDFYKLSVEKQTAAKVRTGKLFFYWSLAAISWSCLASQAKWKIPGELGSVNSILTYLGLHMLLPKCLSWLVNEMISYSDFLNIFK